MAHTTSSTTLIFRALLGVFAFVAIYFTSYFAAWSLSARTSISAPTEWAVYAPIPFAWRIQMAQYWMTIDPSIGRYTRG
jgi:hypothetical protein